MLCVCVRFIGRSNVFLLGPVLQSSTNVENRQFLSILKKQTNVRNISTLTEVTTFEELLRLMRSPVKFIE